MADVIPIRGVEYHAGYLPHPRNSEQGQDRPESSDEESENKDPNNATPPSDAEEAGEKTAGADDTCRRPKGVGGHVDLEA